MRTDASADLALLWESEESVVSGFHGETLLKLGLNRFNLEKDAAFGWLGRQEERQSGIELRQGW